MEIDVFGWDLFTGSKLDLRIFAGGEAMMKSPKQRKETKEVINRVFMIQYPEKASWVSSTDTDPSLVPTPDLQCNTLGAEIFPLRHRARCVGVSTMRLGCLVWRARGWSCCIKTPDKDEGKRRFVHENPVITLMKLALTRKTVVLRVIPGSTCNFRCGSARAQFVYCSGPIQTKYFGPTFQLSETIVLINIEAS